MARKILLADDSVTAQSMGRRILTDAGYEVTTVSNGSAALKRIAESKPDLIVLDVYMPGYGGLEVCQRLKETRETARIPVLLTVGKLEPFKPEEARRVRADAYIVKPFEASELLTALTKLEDKIVPQPEPYKQGRFAKAVASFIAEDPSKDFGDSETGWKNRLTIPAPGAKPEAELEPAPHTGFRNLAREEDFQPAEPSREFERPIPAGLPADISAEEIAAIAAAAAAISGSGEEAPAAPPAEAAVPAGSAEAAPVRTEQPVPEPTAAEQPVGEAAAVQEAKAETPEEETPAEIPAATFASAPEVEAVTAPAAEEAPGEISVTPTAGTPATEEPQAADAAATGESAVVSETPVEVPASPVEAPSVPEPAVAEAAQPASADADLVAALASLAPTNGDAVGHTSPALSSVELAAVSTGISGPRWIAEAMALDEQESAFILEQEMQKAYAAMAAAEAAQAAVVSAEVVAVAEAAPASSAASSSYSAPEFYAAPVAAPEEATPASANSIETAAPLPEEPVVAAAPVPEEVALAAAAGADAGPEMISAVANAPVLAPAESAASPAPEFDDGARQRESELAAAWANWKPAHEFPVEAEASAPTPEPAAVPSVVKEEPPAAEAKSESESAPADEAGEISEIVDDMLAELKPKLMAEISKKLKKKSKK